MTPKKLIIGSSLVYLFLIGVAVFCGFKITEQIEQECPKGIAYCMGKTIKDFKRGMDSSEVEPTSTTTKEP